MGDNLFLLYLLLVILLTWRLEKFIRKKLNFKKKPGLYAHVNKTHKWLEVGLSISALMLAIILIASMVTLVACDNQKQSFSEDELIAAIYNTDFFCINNPKGFSDTSELKIEEIFNLYASTKTVQEKMEQLTSGDGFVEIPLADFKTFVEKYFGDYKFTPTELTEKLSGRLDFDREKEMFYLSAINGGVLWPGAIDSDIVIDDVNNKGDLIIVNATRHYYDNVDIDEYYKITLEVKITKDGYNYVSFKSDKL